MRHRKRTDRAFQGLGGNCSLLAERKEEGEAVLTKLRRVPFGQTQRRYQGDIQPKVGLREWRQSNGMSSSNLLRLCLSPDGGMHQIFGAALPVAGKLELWTQSLTKRRAV